MLILFKTTFIINFRHEKVDNKLYCVVCIMLGIANKFYVKRPVSNPYLGQQSLSYRTSMYVTGPCTNDVHYPCDNCKSDSCLLECERCYKWLCVKCQKVPKAMINALNKYEHLHWYCMSCEVAATKAAAESNMKCRKIKLAETSPDIKTIAEVAQKTADAILNEVQVKLNVQASPDESTKRSYSDVARNISRFTGTINQIVSNNNNNLYSHK